MVLLFDSRGATDDIDAGIYPKNQILEVAREVGRGEVSARNGSTMMPRS